MNQSELNILIEYLENKDPKIQDLAKNIILAKTQNYSNISSEYVKLPDLQKDALEDIGTSYYLLIALSNTYNLHFPYSMVMNNSLYYYNLPNYTLITSEPNCKLLK